MSHRKVFLLFSVLFFCGSLVFGAGSFFETANQAKESGKTVKGQDNGPTDKKNDDNQGNDQSGNCEPGQDEPKDSPADHDNGKGNDDKDKKSDEDKDVVDPDNPCNHPDDPKGDCHPKKVDRLPVKDLTHTISTKFKVKVTVDIDVKVGVKSDCSWSSAHLIEIYRVLYAVPRSFICRDLEIRRVKSCVGCEQVCHVRQTPRVHVCGEGFRPGLLSGLLIREMAKALFISKEFSVLRGQWLKMFWKDEVTIRIKHPFRHPCQTPDEDFGESVKTYWCCGSWLKFRDHARYEFIRRLVMKGRRFEWKHNRCGCDDEKDNPDPVPPASSTWHPPATWTYTPPATGTCHPPATGTCKPPVVNEPPKDKPLPPASGTVKPPAPKPPVASGTPPVPPQNPGQSQPKPTGTLTNVNTGTKTGTNTNPGNGDHGASGKPDENPKNKDNNAGNANNPASQTKTATGVSTGTGTGTGTGTATNGNSGGGDHGASGKTDQNSKNKDNNASNANNPASQGNSGKTTGSGKK